MPVGDAARREPQHFADMYGPVSPKSTPGGYNQLLGVIEAQTGVMSIIPQKDKTRVLQGPAVVPSHECHAHAGAAH